MKKQVKQKAFAYEFYLFCEEILKLDDHIDKDLYGRNALNLLGQLKSINRIFSKNELENDLLRVGLYIENMENALKEYINNLDASLFLQVKNLAKNFINEFNNDVFEWKESFFSMRKRYLRIMIILLSIAFGSFLMSSNYYYQEKFLDEQGKKDLEETILLKRC